MEGMMLYTQGKVVGMIVSLDRPVEFFERMAKQGMDTQRVTVEEEDMLAGTVEVQTPTGLVVAHVVDNLATEGVL